MTLFTEDALPVEKFMSQSRACDMAAEANISIELLSITTNMTVW